MEQCAKINASHNVTAKPETLEYDRKLRRNKTDNATRKFSEGHAKKDTGAYHALKQSTDFIEVIGRVTGWKLDYNWKGDLRHWFTVSYLIFTWSQFFYSQYTYFENGEYKRIIEVFAVYGIALSCVLKVRCFVTYVKEIKAVFDFSFKICRENVGRRGEKLENHQHGNLKLYKWLSFMGLLSAVIYIFHPIKAFVDNRELVSLLPIEILFTNQSTLSGFLIANSFMIVMGVYAVFASLYIGLLFVAAIMNYTMQVDLIEMDMNELDTFWKDKSMTSISERHMFLRNICQKCQDGDNYIARVKKIFDETIYLFFCFAYVSQVLCLYEIKAENWISGYGIAFGLFVEMMFYCFIGTKATIEDDRLCYIITQSNWYTYDVYSQKILLQLLDSCINAKELWIGPLAPLSVLTGTEVVKSIYSYYTLLMEVM